MNCSSESSSVLPALELRGGEEVNNKEGGPNGSCQPEPAAEIFTCNVCLACFLSDGDLKKHGKKIHDIVHPFICNICGYRFSSEINLKEHRKAQHVPDRRNGMPSTAKTTKRKFKKDSDSSGLPLAKLNGNKKVGSGEEPAKKKIKKSSVTRTVPKVQFPCKRCNIVYETYEQWRQHAVFDHIVAKNPYPIVELNYVSPVKREKSATATRSDSDEEDKESSVPSTLAPPKLRITLCKNKGETYRVKKSVIDNLPQEPSTSPAPSIKSDSTERLSPVSVKSEQSEISANTHCSNEDFGKLSRETSICLRRLSGGSEEAPPPQESSSIKKTAAVAAAAAEITLVPNAVSEKGKAGMEEHNGSEYILGLDPRDYDSDVILPDLMSPPFPGGVSLVRDASKNDGLMTPRPPEIEANAQERPVEPVSVITSTHDTRTRIPDGNCGSSTSSLVFDLGDALRGNNEFILPDTSREEGEDRLVKSRQTAEEEAQAVVLRMIEAEQPSSEPCQQREASISNQDGVIRSNGRANETAALGQVPAAEAVNGTRNADDNPINRMNAQERGQPTGVITAIHGGKRALEKFVHEEDSDSDSGLHIHLSEEHSEDTSDAETRSPFSVKGNEVHQGGDGHAAKDNTKDATCKETPLDCSKVQEDVGPQCTVCKKRFLTDEDLQKHFSNEHLSIQLNSSIFEPESPAPVRLRRDIFEEEEPERETATPFAQQSQRQMNNVYTGNSLPSRAPPGSNQMATSSTYLEPPRQNFTLGGKAGKIVAQPPQPMFSVSPFDLSHAHQQALVHSASAKASSIPPPLQPSPPQAQALGSMTSPNTTSLCREDYRYQQQFRLPFTPPEQNHTSGGVSKSPVPFKLSGVTGNTDPDVPRIVQVTSMQNTGTMRAAHSPGNQQMEIRENNYPPNYFGRNLTQPDHEHQGNMQLKNALANKRNSREDNAGATKRTRVDLIPNHHLGNNIDTMNAYQQASSFDQRAMSVLPRAIAYANTPSTLSPTLPRQGSSPNGTACAVNTTQSNSLRLGNAATLSMCPPNGSTDHYQYHQNSMISSSSRGMQGNPAIFNQSRMSQTHQQFSMEAYARMYEASKSQVSAAAAANARAAAGHQFAVPKNPAPRTVTNTSERPPTIDLTHQEFVKSVQNNIQNNRTLAQQQYSQMPQPPQRSQQRPVSNQTVSSKNLERQTTYSCPICRASFISIQMYEEHLRVFHGNVQPQNSSQQPRLSPPGRNRNNGIEQTRPNGSQAAPQNTSPQPQQSAGPQNSGRNGAPKSLCIPILDFNKVDAQKLRKLEELGITGVIPLAGYDKSVGSLGIPIMPLRPERVAGAQLPWESVLPLGPAHLPSLLTSGMAAFQDYERQNQSSRVHSPR